MRQVGDVEPFSGQNVALTKRLRVPAAHGIQSLVDVHVNLHVHLLQASVALAVRPRIDAAVDRQHAVGLTKLQPDSNRVRKDYPFERFDWDLVGHQHHLATAAEETADIDPVRTIHKTHAAAV